MQYIHIMTLLNTNCTVNKNALIHIMTLLNTNCTVNKNALILKKQDMIII